MHVDGSLAHDHIIAPDFLQDFFPLEHFLGIWSQQIQQVKLFFRKQELLSVFGYPEVIFIDNQISDLDQFRIIRNLGGELQ